MAKTKKRKKKSQSGKITALLVCLVVLTVMIAGIFALDVGKSGGVREVEGTTFGIDVARYQGTIDWAEAAENGVDFAMVRLGYRGLVTGEIVEDSNARYNMQEASRRGIKLGAYFFSTAVTAEEAKEEAAWAAEILAQYPITYPVAYDCEGFRDPGNRHYHLSVAERTDIALVFLSEIEKYGYEAMFYASKNEMEGDTLWQVSRIQNDYKVWVAQYPPHPYPETEKTDYNGIHQMWQYTREGEVRGISGPVDMDVAYFAYEGIALPKDSTPPETVGPDIEAMMEFEPVWEHVTAKEQTNLRDIPSQDDTARILHTLKNGEVTMRTGVSESGWSRLVFEGVTCYAVSSYLTTDLEPPATEADDGIQTVFRKVDDRVTAKDAVNLRTIPSVTDPESEVVVKLKHGEVVQRTGINEDVGSSRVVWNGQTLYCVTSYLEIVTE
jgi:GH25 family lysozyme M1 (1,4-beta-N-acetylmuramidase)